MSMLVVATVLLAVVLQQSTGQQFLGALHTNNENVQKEIIDTINSLRRNVKPPSQNMLQMGPAKVKRLDATSCGEALHKTSNPISWTDVINKWYAQEENFTYGSGERFPNAHYGLYTKV